MAGDATLDLPAGDQIAAGSEFAVGGMIGHFVIRGRLGEGGMGVVLAGHDADLGRPVAIKLVRSDVDHGGYRARLLREAMAMARLEHPNVVRVYEVGSDRGRLFVAMELVDGDTLTHWLHATRRSWRELVAMFEQVGAGLAAVHRVGLVHRDFKPDNVLVDRAGHARVADFGLARLDRGISATSASPGLAKSLTRTGVMMGTPGYIAPEQQLGGDVDARADQYSYCVALREALLGGRALTPGDPRWRGVPRAVRGVVMRGLAYDPSERFASIDELLAALRRAMERRLTAVGAGLAALALVAVIGGAVILRGAGEDRVGIVDAGIERVERLAVAPGSAPDAGPIRLPVAPSRDAGVAALTARADGGSVTLLPPIAFGGPPPGPPKSAARHALDPAHRAAVQAAFASLGYRGLSFQGDPSGDERELEDKLAATDPDDPLTRARLQWALGAVQRRQGECDAAQVSWLAARKSAAAANHKVPLDNAVWQWFGVAYFGAALCDFELGHADQALADLQQALAKSFAVSPAVRAEMLLASGILDWETLDQTRGRAVVLQAGRSGDAALRKTLETWASSVGFAL